jgi:hypothetical protein
MFKSKDRSKGGMAERLKAPTDCMHPKANYDIVLGRDVAKGGWNTGCKQYLEQIASSPPI